MATIPLTTRISRGAAAILRTRAKRASLGPSAYASRLLESVLLGREAVQIGTESIPRSAQRALGAELFFVSLAMTKVLEKHPGLVSKIRKEARELAAEQFGEKETPSGSETHEDD